MTGFATPVDQGLFREVMGHYPTGVAVVTGRADDGELLALVVGTWAALAAVGAASDRSRRSSRSPSSRTRTSRP